MREREREREREKEREREREKDIDMREKHPAVASIGTLTGDGTCSLLVYGMMLQATAPSGQGSNLFL